MGPVNQLPLTILEEFLLLALNDEAGQFYSLARSTLDCASAGAVLMDLTLHHRLDNDLKSMFITHGMPIGDDLLDPVLEALKLAPVTTPHSINHWLSQMAGEGEALREKALRRLEERGIIKREDKKILWVFGSRHYPVQHDSEVREVKLRILGVILRDDIPNPHDMMLTALAQSCGLFSHILSRQELEAALPRIELVAKMDLIGQAVARAVGEIEAAIVLTTGFR
ncbi:MAG: GPP34 family phosphoprotein [Alphaproteobacteria bacterium]